MVGIILGEGVGEEVLVLGFYYIFFYIGGSVVLVLGYKVFKLIIDWGVLFFR